MDLRYLKDNIASLGDQLAITEREKSVVISEFLSYDCSIN